MNIESHNSESNLGYAIAQTIFLAMINNDPSLVQISPEVNFQPATRVVTLQLQSWYATGYV
jgi:hypothetical protein